MSETPWLLDAETSLVGEHWAVVYAPRRQRNRFPANCVQVCESEATARERADRDRSLFPARLMGPSKSSEGLMMFYLVRWLE